MSPEHRQLVAGAYCLNGKVPHLMMVLAESELDELGGYGEDAYCMMEALAGEAWEAEDELSNLTHPAPDGREK